MFSETLEKLRWILVAFVLMFYSSQVVGTTNEPWNQLGANVDTSNSPHGQAQGGTLQPQRNPTTTPPRSTTTASYNSTEVSSNSTEISSNSTEVDFNTTTIIPNTNLDQDGLTDSSKSPTSSKPLTKAVTVDSSLVSPDFVLNEGTTEELPSSAETLTNRSTLVMQSSSPYNTSTQMASSNTTQTASPTSPSSTVLSSKLLVTELEFSNATSSTPPVTRELTQMEMTTEPEIATQYSTTSAMPSSATPKIHTTAFTETMSTTDTISTPSQSTTISVTPQVQRTSTEFDQTSISATFAPRITNITQPRSSSNTGRTLTVHTSTHSMPNQTATIIIVTKSHQHGVGKVTKQSDEQQGPSAEPATEEYQHPIDGDHNDPDLPSDPAHPKDPSNNQNIPNNRYPEGHRENEQMTIRPDIYPPVYIQLVLIMSSSTFCHERYEIELELVKVAKDIVSSPPDIQAGFIGIDRICDFGNASTTEVPGAESSVTMEFYLTVADMYDANTTRKVGDALEEDPSLLNRYITVKVSAVYILSNTDMLMPTHDSVKQVNTLSIEVSVPLGFIFMLVLGIAAFVIYKAYKLRVARQTYKDRYYFDGKQLQDSMSDTQKLSPKESKAAARLNLLVPAINQALELDEPDEIALQVFPSHILSINALAKFYTYIEAIVQEYQTLPDFQAILRNKPPPSPHSPRRLAATLPGHQLFDKYHHRHHGFQSPTKTQVKLEKITLGDSPSPINANFVVGYNESSYAYIACQAPQGAGDEFWQMVWEQQSKTIILLCAPEEMGTRCSWYWPKDMGIQSAQLYGDILVMLQGQVRTENYIMSTLLIKDMQKNLCRPVIHCWFCQWPEMEIPINPRALIVFLMQVRQTYQENPGPIVVSCSDGCGRTGTLISIDICMQSLEDVRSVDIPSTVSNVRQDRGSAVHNREQYSFIYKVLYEYSTMLIASGCPESNFMAQSQTTQSMPLRVMYQ